MFPQGDRRPEWYRPNLVGGHCMITRVFKIHQCKEV